MTHNPDSRRKGGRRSLTRIEELILLSILNLKGEAYLVAIVDHLSRITGKNVSVTSVYFPLSRLEKMNLIQASFGEATAVRGGRRKKIYSVAPSGFDRLNEHKRISDLLWKNYAELSAPRD